MLNENLPHQELLSDLSKYVDRANLILSEIESNTVNIMDDKKTLALLHHALNIANYKKPEFRKLLLRRAEKNKLEKFLRELKLIDSSINNYDIEKLVQQASNLSWSNNNSTKHFVEIFGYESNLIPDEIEQIPEIETCKSYGEPLKTLNSYQSSIFFKSIHLVVAPWSKFIIRMPTGAGKTRTTMEIVCHFLKDVDSKGFDQIVWIADRDELCEQAITSIKEVWPHVGNKELKIYRLWGSRKHDSFENPSFIVATYQTLNNLLEKGKTFPEPHLVISDEAHNVLAPTYEKVLNKLSKNHTRIIGLTATPIRSDNNETKRLIEFFNQEIIEIDSKGRNVIEYLQGLGYLAHCIPKSIPSNREYRLNSVQRKELAKDGDIPLSKLDEIARDDKRNIIIAESLLQLHKENKQVLYFAPSVEQSKFMCMILLAKGASAAHIDGDTPIEYRRDVIAKFREGRIKFIFNYSVFTTGFDAPNINVVFIARPTTSLVLHQQMIGRGMRGKNMGGTDSFELYRIVDNMPDIDLADDFFSDIWKY